MSSRRTRIKVTPNLAGARSRGGPATPTQASKERHVIVNSVKVDCKNELDKNENIATATIRKSVSSSSIVLNGNSPNKSRQTELNPVPETPVSAATPPLTTAVTTNADNTGNTKESITNTKHAPVARTVHRDNSLDRINRPTSELSPTIAAESTKNGPKQTILNGESTLRITQPVHETSVSFSPHNGVSNHSNLLSPEPVLSKHLPKSESSTTENTSTKPNTSKVKQNSEMVGIKVLDKKEETENGTNSDQSPHSQSPAIETNVAAIAPPLKKDETTDHASNGFETAADVQKVSHQTVPTCSSNGLSDAGGHSPQPVGEETGVAPTNTDVKPAPSAKRKFVGLRSRFKPNLFTRCEQMEEGRRRERNMSLLLAEQNSSPVNSGRSRKNSASDNLENQPRSRKLSTSDKIAVPTDGQTTRTRKNSSSESGTIRSTRKNSVGEPDSINERLVNGSGPAASHSRNFSSGDPPSPVTELPSAAVNSRTRSSSPDREETSIKVSKSLSAILDKKSSSQSTKLPSSPPPRQTCSPLPAAKHRMRRQSDSNMRRTSTERTNYQLKRRKGELRRRFSQGVPGRQVMTMFDLIYYNPENGTEIVADDPQSKDSVHDRDEVTEEREDDPSAANDTVTSSANDQTQPSATNVSSRSADHAAADDNIAMDDDENSMPVPQVKVGPNGEIILDEESTLLETNASKRAKSDLTSSPVVVENANRLLTNYGTWSKKRRYSDWSERDTFKFYRALSIVGSDFSMMESLFKRRTRHELKLKFKKEERLNGALVDKCLLAQQGGQFADIAHFIEGDETEDEEKIDRPTRGRKRKNGSSRRRKFSSRGMYESSSGGEDADVSETSRSPARQRSRDTQPAAKRSKRLSNAVAADDVANSSPVNGVAIAADLQSSITPLPVTTNTVAKKTKPSQQQTTVVAASTTRTTALPAGLSPRTAAANSSSSSISSLAGVNFPPALLAANPGLAGAKPGSLVVVASPSKTDPSSQLLHVYMVSDKRKKDTPNTPTNNSAVNTTSVGRPAVIRAGQSTVSVAGNSGLGRPLDPSRLSIDPAVVRAVNRKRASTDRVTTSGSKADLANYSPSSNGMDSSMLRRQRTLSEGNVISSSNLSNLITPRQGSADLTRGSTGSPSNHAVGLGARIRSVSLQQSPAASFAESDGTDKQESETTSTSEPQGIVTLPQLPMIARKSKPV